MIQPATIKWHPIDEGDDYLRLPSRSCPVLLTLVSGEVAADYFWLQWETTMPPNFAEFPMSEVKAWAYLPKPYSEDKTDDL